MNGYKITVCIGIFFMATIMLSGSPIARAGVIDPNVPIISYVNFKSADQANPLTISGQLRVPATNAEEKVPAVVIVHGSAGVDSRGAFYSQALNEAGIATLEIDMWAPRGWLGGITGRPSGVPETVPDAYGALKFLSQQPFIDPERIGIMGFSWGGVVTMLSATTPYASLYAGDTAGFAAHVAEYPVCWVYNVIPGYGFSSFTGAPLLIQAGELDAYDKPDTCQNLVQSLPPEAQEFISVRVYKNVTHAWDRLQPAMTVTDPYSHLGMGGEVEFVPNPGKAFQSRSNVVRFFQEAFGMTP
jgi:dienelactone hydrolase